MSTSLTVYRLDESNWEVVQDQVTVDEAEGAFFVMFPGNITFAYPLVQLNRVTYFTDPDKADRRLKKRLETIIKIKRRSYEKVKAELAEMDAELNNLQTIWRNINE